MTIEITNVEQIAKLEFEDKIDKVTAMNIIYDNSKLKEGERPVVLKLHISAKFDEIRVFRYNKVNWRYEFIDYFPIKKQFSNKLI